MVFGLLVGSIVLVPIILSMPSIRRLHVPSEPWTIVKFLAYSSVDLLPLISRDTIRHVPSMCLRSFWIAVSLASSAEAIAPMPATNARQQRSDNQEPDQ